MKIYDARENGGFLVVPPLPLCAATDECHGPGTPVAPPPQIGTFKGEGGNVKRCRKGFVKKNGKCVKKKKARRGRRGRARGACPRRAIANARPAAMAESRMRSKETTMSTQTTSARSSRLGAPCVWSWQGLSVVLAAAALAAPAGAVEPIESFNASLSTDQAGGHPDINFDFALEDPGEPEAAKK